MEQSVAVWLICKDGDNKGRIALQRRSEVAEIPGRGKVIQSYPLVCQSTWGGRLDPNEDLRQALRRTAKGELGEVFSTLYGFDLTEFNSGKYSHERKKIKVHNFLGFTSDAKLELIKLHGRVFPNFVFISPADVKDIKSHSDLVDPRNEIVLFRYQLKALRVLKELKEKLGAWS